jgi:tRNA nucleotidyltransferase (CCA-adding enzyme)
MEVFLVGGAVRDSLLGEKVRDRDYIVCGGSETDLRAKGFQKILSSPNVYIDPKTQDEYTLVERAHFIEELKRRDFTINAIAKNCATGEIVDPLDGLLDIEKRVLRHVGQSLREDPVRVLRASRFLARFPMLKLADETYSEIKLLSENRELFANIPSERILLEMKKAFKGPRPSAFFENLKKWNFVELFLPELSLLDGVPQPPRYHPEGDCWNHTMLVLNAACKLSNKFSVQFACLVHDLGKGKTPTDNLPKHYGHESRGVPLVKRVCERLRVSKKCEQLSMKVCLLHLKCHRIFEMSEKKVVDLLYDLDAFRNKNFLEDFIVCCHADFLGKNVAFRKEDYPQGDYLKKVRAHLAKMSTENIVKKYSGELIQIKIREERISYLKRLRSSQF